MCAEKKLELERVYSTTEAKNQLSAMISFVQEPDAAAIIESHGKPRAVLVSFDDFEAIRKLKDKERRRLAWKQLEALRKEVSSRNQDLWHLSDEELLEYVDGPVREAFQELHDSGRLYRKSNAPQ